MDKKKIALIVVVLFLLIGLGSFVFANPDQDNNLEGPGVSEDGGNGDGEVIDGTEPTTTPEEENDDSATETDPITTYGNGSNGTGTGAGNNGTTGGVGNTDMSQYDDARRIIEELENRVNAMQNKDDSNDAVDYRTDTDIIDMVNNLPDGTVKDELKDRLDAINKVLDDTTAPVITGINNNDVTKENVTINVTDDNDVTITATLDGEEIEFTTPLTEEGHYVVTVTDKNFNTTTVEFTIDKTAPEYAAMGIFNWTNDNDGTGRTYATKDEHIRLYVSFPEMLATNPKVDIYGQDGKVTTLELTYSEAAKFYFVEFDTTDELNLPEGKISFKVYGYADEAENVGVELTQDMTTSKDYPYVIYDSIAPVLNFNNGFITDAFTVVATDDNFDYMTVQYYDGREMKTITENTFTLDAEGDNIRYNIKAYDKAGNVSAYADIYLDTQAPVLSGTGINGKNEVEVKDGGYYKNATIHFEDGSLKKVVLVNEDGTEEVLEEYKDNYTTSKMVFARTFKGDGTYTIKAIDRKGNETVVTFTIDTVKPVITGVENGAITNQNVILNVTDENPGGTIHLKRNGQIVKNYSFGTAITEEGNYEVYVSDLAGNVSETVKFTIEKTAPVITVKEDYVGNLDKNVFSNVSFKLYDNTGVSAYKINDGEYKDLTVSNWSDANFQNIKNELVYGSNTITLRDVAGNETTYTFTYDNVAPTITVKDGYVGDLDKKVFSNVSFSLYDEYEVVAYKINEGEYGKFTANNWSDANFQNIVSRLVYGKNTITLKDVAGNEAVYEFVYDNVQPTINVKEGYVGSLDQNIFSNVSFSLYDEYEVVAYKINDGEYGEFTANNWSDANFQNIVSRLAYGKNTITLKDVAGNEATYEFTYDNIAPVVLENNSTGSNDIFSLVNLKLYDANGITSLVINGVQYPHTGTYIDINDGYIYTFPEGENTIEFTDIAGNKTVYTFTVDKTAPEVKFPATHNSNADYKGWKTLTITISDTKLSEVYYTWANTNKYVNATTQVPAENITDNGDGTYTVKVPTVDGRNRLNIKTIDVAGNVTEVYSTSGAYNIDLVAPTVAFPATHNSNASYKNWKTLAITISDRELSEVYYTWANTNKYVNATTHVPAENITDNGDGTYTVNVPTVNGRNRLNIKAVDAAGNVTEVYSTSGAYNIDNEDLVVTVSKSNNDKSTNQDVVITLVGNKPISAEGWTQVSDNTIQKVYSENGKYSVVATDKNGNQVTVNFEVKRIDKVAPEATVVKSNNDKSTNQDVTVTIVANEAIYKPEGWTEVTTNKEHEFTKVYSENGKYSVVITDKAGNETTINFEVKRIDKVAPVMTVISPNRYEIEQGSVYVDKGYSAWDAVDKDVTNLVQISYRFIAAGTGDYVSVPEIDTNKIGQYVVTYTAYDKAGNSSQSTRVVEIVPKTEG